MLKSNTAEGPNKTEMSSHRSLIRRHHEIPFLVILKQPNKESHIIYSLFFDGHKDHTIINIQKGSRWHQRKFVEEYISLLEELRL